MGRKEYIELNPKLLVLYVVWDCCSNWLELLSRQLAGAPQRRRLLDERIGHVIVL